MRRVDLGFMFKSDEDSARAQVSYFYPVSFCWQLWIVHSPSIGGQEGGWAGTLLSSLLLVSLANPQRIKMPFRVTIIKTHFERGVCCQNFIFIPRKIRETIFGLSAHDLPALLQINRNYLHAKPCAAENMCHPPSHNSALGNGDSVLLFHP